VPITTGGFEDLVQLSQDTLYYVGPDLEIGNTSVGSSASLGFNNTAGVIQVVGVATGNETLWLPTNNGTLATVVTLSNSNNVSFGLNGSTITASAVVNVSAGTASNNLSAITFSNSNGVSFGLNGSVITASAAGGGGGVAIADDNGHTISNSTVQFSNSNGVSFGLNGSTMTGSVATSLTNINVSAGTTSNNLSVVVFSNSNNVSFGLNGSTVTASAEVNVSAGTTSFNLSAITFSNGNGVSFGLSAGSILTASAGITTGSVLNISAGTTSANLGTVVFSNSNNVSFGLNGSTITASANVTGDYFDNLYADQPVATGSGALGAISNFTGSVSSLFVAPLNGFGALFPFDITANTCFFPDVSVSGSTATMSIAFTSIWRLGVYTLNASSLSLLNSASLTFGAAAAATNNSTAFAGGFRYGTFSSNAWSSSPVFRYGSRYWLAWMWSSSGALNQTGSLAGNFMFSTGQRSGLLGVSNLTATSNGAAPFYGIYSAQTAALPASIGSNQLQKTGSMAGFVPHLIMANNASLTVF